MIPACVEHFSFNAALFGFLSFEQIESKPPECGEVFGCMSGSGSTLGSEREAAGLRAGWTTTAGSSSSASSTVGVSDDWTSG